MRPAISPRVLHVAARQDFTDRFAADVRYYMTQQPRQLPSRYFYDELGSSLFEAICRLPWYPITTAERRLLDAHAREILERARPTVVVELGSGSGDKMRRLLIAREQDRSLDVHLVDLSASALDQSSRLLAPLDGVRLTLHRASYEEGLGAAVASFVPGARALVLFLGSNIGNFDPPSRDALLSGIRRTLRQGDRLLIGADLVKPEQDLLLAYDDPLGVTAAFNRNLLVRVNRELEADFQLDQFSHRAVWNEPASRMEMHLIAGSRQHVEVRRCDLAFDLEAGEPIWTESSYKFHPETMMQSLQSAGFRSAAQWIDPVGRFALTLADAL